MPTLLTTSKMAPELQERVRASVEGRRGRDRSRLPPTVVALIRFGIGLAVVGLIAAAFVARRGVTREVDAARANVLVDVRGPAADLTERDKTALISVHTWLTRLAGANEGDLISPELRAPNALAQSLAEPTLYVRGPADGFRNDAAILGTAATSLKDALLLCMIDPPSARTEKALLPNVRMAYAAGPTFRERTTNAHRLEEAEGGLPILLPAFAERVHSAEGARELHTLASEVERFPPVRTLAALRAKRLIVAIDEAAPAGPSELDGEKPHDVQFAIVDLARDAVILRLKRHVDPSAWGTSARAEYASGMDGCALALDVRAAVVAGAQK